MKSTKLNILIVDDNQLNLIVMKHLFNFQEYEVHFAECGEAALEMARKFKPDLILLDVVMPDISGFDVCRILKEDPDFKKTSVIFITAASEIDFMIEAFEAGGNDFITKPFRQEDILLRIKKHINLKRTSDQLHETTTYLYELKRVQHRLESLIGKDLLSPPGIDLKMIFEFMSRGLIDPTKDENYKQTILDLLSSSNKSFSVLENLNAWATIESGNLKNEPENINLKVAIVSLVNLYQHTIQSNKLQLNLKIVPDHVVFVDRNLLKTIIQNLLSNAIKYTPAGGAISFNSEIGPRLMKITVSDTGIGMPAEILDKILEPDVFYSSPGLNKEIGNGLGLKLCREFIEKSKGQIWIDSSPEEGTTVYFTLPPKNENSLTEDYRSLVW